MAPQTLHPLHRLQVPEEDGGALIEPPFNQVPELVAENLRLRERYDYDLQGRSLAEISALGREELLAAARRWTIVYRDVAGTPQDAASTGPIFLAGHQPQMFHPGVWFKNFVLGELSARHGATAINLIVDGDLPGDASLTVPCGSVAAPYFAAVPFDRPDPNVPYEERRIEDRQLFARFGQQVIDRMTGLVSDPLMRQYWPMVQRRARDTDNLGACIAQARHQLEGAWGLQTLEVPESWLCRGAAFSWFAVHLLASLPRFRRLYNEAVREYRRVHHLRSLSHPAPELAADGTWLEAPLWIWTADNPHRRRLFAKPSAREIILSDRESWQARLPLQAEGDAGQAVERLQELQGGSVRIRPRALVTTLWARLALGDLFIHGIGGAKYDWVTDLLMERFFGISPLRFLVVSATLHLPIPGSGLTPRDARAIKQELRAMTYHPERFVGMLEGRLAELVAAKRRWIETPETPQNARQRHQAIREINETLQPALSERRRQLADRQAEISRRLRAESILASREYAFCLYPEATLRAFLARRTEFTPSSDRTE
jgi:hypothetical protein